MKKIICAALMLLSAIGIVTSVTAGENAMGTAGKRGLSTIATIATVTDQSAAASRKYDAVLGACQFVEIGNEMGSAINSIPALAPVGDFLKLGPNDPLGPRKVTVLEQPRHGVLQLDTKVADAATRGGPWHYSPDAAYFGGNDKFYKGSDQFSFEVEANGKRFKVIYTVYVVFPVEDVINNPINNSCPSGGATSWRISDEGSVTGNESSAMALNSWLTSSELDGFIAAASGVTLSFENLSGGAVGQTTGGDITLDTNAAGNGWFIEQRRSPHRAEIK
jgi:hypothetical protein